VTVRQLTLTGGGEPRVDETVRVDRTWLDDASWVDVGRAWLRGADTLLDALTRGVAWSQGRRWMYERMVDDPRLSYWTNAGEPVPHPALDDVKGALERRYSVRFGGVGLNYYRDGADSVAWHRDRELRELDDTLIAIVTLGGPRSFLVRPVGKGRSRDFSPGSGDLLVMGGRCQMDWEHSVPKVLRAGARLSCTWRWSRGRAPSYSGGS